MCSCVFEEGEGLACLFVRVPHLGCVPVQWACRCRATDFPTASTVRTRDLCDPDKVPLLVVSLQAQGLGQEGHRMS